MAFKLGSSDIYPHGDDYVRLPHSLEAKII